MPPSHSFWVIVHGSVPTAFRARQREDLLPTLVQLQRTQQEVSLVWFENGRTWESPEAAREALEARRRMARERKPSWRPGGAHIDPREKYKLTRDQKRARFKERAKFHGRPPRDDDDQKADGQRPERAWKPKAAGDARRDRPWRPKGPGGSRGSRPDRPWRPKSPDGSRPEKRWRPKGPAGPGSERSWRSKAPPRPGGSRGFGGARGPRGPRGPKGPKGRS